MELKNAIYERRSVRKYLDKPIEAEVLKEIIDAGLWAPSAVNLQPWYFVVINTPEKMAELLEIMKTVSDRSKKHLEERFSGHPEVVKDTLNFISFLGNAPCAVLAFRDAPDYSWAASDFAVIQSIAMAVENIVLSAYDHGVSSCILTAPMQADMCGVLRDRFAPGHGELVVMASLGYSDSKPNAPKRKSDKYIII